MLRRHDWYQRFYEIALLPRHEKTMAIETELRKIVQPDALSALFDEFLAETRNAIHVNMDSYMHDNGFDKIILFQDEVTKMKMRLHLWHPILIDGVERIRQNVHNHRWDFTSAVLLGEMTHIAYRFGELQEEGAEPFHHYRYFARGSKEHYDVEKLGVAHLVRTSSQVQSAGILYSVENETLHRVDVPSRISAATVVITHENMGWVTNDLLSEKGFGMEKAKLPSPALARDEIIRKVETLRNQLEKER